MADPTGVHSPTTGRFTQTSKTAETDAAIARLRLEGKSYRAIANELKIDIHTAHDGLKRAYRNVVAPDVATLRAVENDKLDELEERAWEVMNRRHYFVSGQQASVINGPNGEPLFDSAPVLNAIDRVLRISIERRKLNGMDVKTASPRQIDEITESALDQAIEQLEREKEQRLRLVG